MTFATPESFLDPILIGLDRDLNQGDNPFIELLNQKVNGNRGNFLCKTGRYLNIQL